MFDPKPTRYPFPEYTDRHYLVVKKNDGTVFDRNYPYIDRSPLSLFKQWAVRILLNIIVFPVARIRLGLRIKGRENIKKHRDVIRNGVVSMSNHVHLWDFICIMCAVRPSKPYVLTWAPNVRGENGKMMRSVRCIPIPENDVHATKAYLTAVEKMVREGGWLHVYPEGSMWEFYQPIRPFKTGAASLACKFGKPVIPMGFSYRKPGFIRKKIFRQAACFTLNIGEPVYANGGLGRREQAEDLTARCHAEVCKLAGIEPEKNIYEPIFNNSKRIDYYTSEYGIS